jgi:hypothetical protein
LCIICSYFFLLFFCWIIIIFINFFICFIILIAINMNRLSSFLSCYCCF